MNSEERKHMASRTIDLNKNRDTIAIQVSGQKATLIVVWPVEDKLSDVPAFERKIMEMSLDDLERVIAVAQEVVKESKAFEAAHPKS